MSTITSVKSKFAKFIDQTLGAVLIFFAAVAVLRYFIAAADVTVVCAIAVTASICLLAKLRGAKKTERIRISEQADDMFFQFMFLPENAPAKLLAAGLKAKGEQATVHGAGVFLNGVAAYCAFFRSDEAQTARTIAKAKHYGATKLVLLSKTPQIVPETDGMTVTSVCGDDVYKLFASLNSLPQKKYSQNRKKTKNAFKNAFSVDKIIRYILLSAVFFFVARFSHSIITFSCALLCAAFAVISITVAAVRKFKKIKKDKI